MRHLALAALVLLCSMAAPHASAHDNCATTSTYAFCKLEGLNVPADHIRAALDQTDEASFGDIQTFLQGIQCPTLILQCNEPDIYNLKTPLIAYIKLKDGNAQATHFTTIVRTDRTRGVQIADPMLHADTLAWISRKDFARVFQNYVLIKKD